MKVQKRFQYWSRDGKAWSEWFDYGGEHYPHQLKYSSKERTLLNEYRTVQE